MLRTPPADDWGPNVEPSSSNGRVASESMPVTVGGERGHRRPVALAPVVTYLSDEWLEQAGTALATNQELSQRSAELDVKIGYLVPDAPSGKVAYTVSLDHGTVALTPGAAGKLVDPAPVSFELNYATAAAIAKGELSAQAAFMQGSLKLVGNVDVLIRDGAALDGITDALADLRASTDF